MGQQKRTAALVETYCHSSFFNNIRPFYNSMLHFYSIIWCHFYFYFLNSSSSLNDPSSSDIPDFIQMMGQGVRSSSRQIDSCGGIYLNQLSWLPKIHVSTPSPPPPPPQSAPQCYCSCQIFPFFPCSWKVQLWALVGVVECMFRAEQLTSQLEFVLSTQSTSSYQRRVTVLPTSYPRGVTVLPQVNPSPCH